MISSHHLFSSHLALLNSTQIGGEHLYWGLLGRSWGDLGASWAPLGGLLGAFWADLKAFKTTFKMKSDNKSQFGENRISFGGGLGGQNRPQMAPATSQKLRRFSRAKKLLFKSLLEPSWADLRAFWVPSWGQKKRSGIGKRNIW